MLKKTFLYLWEILKIAIIASVIVVPIRYFLFQPFIVRGASMEPNFHSNDYLIVDEISYRFRHPERGEVIVFHYPNNPSQRYIKRVIGLPGETLEIKDGRIFITPPDSQNSFALDESAYLPPSANNTLRGEEKIVLKKGQYFVIGDNRAFSYDSRSWGPLSEKFIIGRVLFRAWPLSAFAKIRAPAY